MHIYAELYVQKVAESDEGACKCLLVLLYGLEVCPLKMSDLRSLDYVVNRFFEAVQHKC